MLLNYTAHPNGEVCRPCFLFKGIVFVRLKAVDKKSGFRNRFRLPERPF